MLEVKNLGLRLKSRWLVRQVSFSLTAPGVTAIIGPNGSGKTTLLRLLSGELQSTEGEIHLRHALLSGYAAADLARLRALLPQTRAMAFPYAAAEVVAFGRVPFRNESASRDRQVVESVMEQCGITHLREQSYPSLSGGEAARVDLARVLAQEPILLFLDEPTNHLDLSARLEVMRLCRRLAQTGCYVVAVLHDLALAGQFADQILLMNNGHQVAYGQPREVLTPKRLRAVFRVPFHVGWGADGRCHLLPIDEYETATEPEAILWQKTVVELKTGSSGQ